MAMTGRAARGRGRWRVLAVAVVVVLAVGTAVLLPASPASAAPGVPAAPTVVFTEDFENVPDPSKAILLDQYVGTSPLAMTYTAHPLWISSFNCNGVVASYNSTGNNPCDEPVHYDIWVREAAQAMGIAKGGGNDNQVVAHATGRGTNQPATPEPTLQTANPIQLPSANRFVAFSIDVADVFCNGANSLLRFFLVDGANEFPVNDQALRICTEPGAQTVPTANFNAKVGTVTTDRAVLFPGGSIGLKVTNDQTSGHGNDYAVDNLRVLDATPQLDKAFSPSNVTPNRPSKLTFTVTNTSELGAKEGWSFTDNLASGLVVAPTPNVATNCANGVVTAAAGGSSIDVSGDLTGGQVSCTASVDVVGSTPGTYTNGASNTTDLVGMNAPTSDASVNVLAPFTCDASTVFVAQGEPTQLNALQYGSGSSSFQPIGAAHSPSYNAMGYNEADDFIYAMQSDGHVLRIGAGAQVTDLGPPNPPLPFLVTGTVGADGIYYVLGFDNGVPTLWKIDLATLSSTATQVTGAGAPMPPDFSFVDGQLWGDAGNDLIRIDPVSGVAVKFAQTVVPASVGAGAAWTYGNGNLGLSDNNSGDLYQIRITDPNSASPGFSLVSRSPGPPSSFNDGTSCTGLPTDLGITKTSSPERVDPGGQVTWTLTVHNYGPGISSGYVVTDQVPAQVTNLSTATPGCSFSGNTLTCVGGVLGVGDEDLITYTGTAPDEPGVALVNQAGVIANEVDPNPDNNQVSGTAITKQLVGLCRGTALDVRDIRFGSANEPETPCRTKNASELRTNVGDPLSPPAVSAKVLEGHTQAATRSAAAQAGVTSVQLDLPGLSLSATGVRSEVEASVASGCAPVAKTWTSNVASITINGQTTVVGDRPRTIPVEVGTVYVNQRIRFGSVVIARGIFVDLPGTGLDVTVAESRAGMSCQ